MATIPQTAPYNLDIMGPPVMDLTEGTGLDFGDEDIDLDLRSTGQQDDDLSIYDATDAGLDVQTISADQDDFMVDHEDVIEEDDVNHDEDTEIVDTEQLPFEEAETSNETSNETANVEDDLIDYSDEEGDTTWNNSELPSKPVEAHADDTAKSEDKDEAADQKLPGTQETAAQEQHAQDPQDENGPQNMTNREDDPHAHDDDFQEFAEQPEDALEEDGHSTNQPNEPEPLPKNEDTQGQVDFSSNAYDDATLREQAPRSDPVPQESQLHPVTVNYDSAELWLFKHHDYENSGDFLIEEEDLASKPLSSLFEACRAALGSDITDDMELGFRLDNFHNIELYQEHTSCAFVTLEHLVHIYQQLHIQDGVSDPESFYMTILYRPRVSALLNELSKAAAEGIGHTGLDRAIAAGLTAFSAHLSHNSTEHILEDWDNDEEQHEQHEQDVQDEEDLSEQAGHKQNDDGDKSEIHEHSYEELEEELDEEHNQDLHETNRPEQASPAEVQSTGHATDAPAASPSNAGLAAVGSRTLTGDETSAVQPLVDPSHSNSAHGSPTSHHDEEDIIDYSDEELEPEADITQDNKAATPSSSSSTVQGDNTLQVQEDDEDPAGDYDASEFAEPAHGHGGEESGAGFPGDGAQDALYDMFDEELGNEYAHETEEVHALGVATGELEEYSTEDPTQISDENTDQYGDVEYGNIEMPFDTNQDEHVEDEDDSNYPSAYTTTVEGDLAAVEEVFDVDTVASHVDPSTGEQADFVTGEDELEYDEDDEDGVAGQAPVAAASAAAEPVDTLSSELLELSPQGQKRTIDEVGIDLSEATDSSDAKRPRV